MIFPVAGRVNSQETVEYALKTASERGISHIVISSNTGDSAMLLAKSDLNIVCVSHANGFAQNGQNELSAEIREKLLASGVQVVTASHVLSGAERGISRQAGGMYPAEIMAGTLRMFGQGTKVCVETAVMALDAGAIPYGEKIIAIGGTGRGVDTAVILTPSHAQSILDTRIHEILCKPML